MAATFEAKLQVFDARGSRYYLGRIRLDMDQPIGLVSGWIVGVGQDEASTTHRAVLDTVRVAPWLTLHGMTRVEAEDWFRSVQTGIAAEGN